MYPILFQLVLAVLHILDHHEQKEWLHQLHQDAEEAACDNLCQLPSIAAENGKNKGILLAASSSSGLPLFSEPLNLFNCFLLIAYDAIVLHSQLIMLLCEAHQWAQPVEKNSGEPVGILDHLLSFKQLWASFRLLLIHILLFLCTTILVVLI